MSEKEMKRVNDAIEVKACVAARYVATIHAAILLNDEAAAESHARMAFRLGREIMGLIYAPPAVLIQATS